MAAIESWFADTLTDDAAVTALVGTRVFAVKIPQAASLPAVAYLRRNTTRKYTSSRQDPLATVTLEAHIVAASYTTVKDLADKVRLTASGFSGADSPFNIRRCFLVNEYDDPEYPEFADDKVGYRVVQVWEIVHSEVAPTF